MAWGGDWQLSDQSTGVGRVAFFKLCDGSRIGLVSQFLQAPFDKSSWIYMYIDKCREKTVGLTSYWSNLI